MTSVGWSIAGESTGAAGLESQGSKIAGNAVTRDAVLLVDDEPQVLLALDDILSEHFTVVKASCAERALAAARERRDIAVVVTDQRMPRTNGDELVARLATFSDATRIMLTGYAELDAVIRAVNSGGIYAYVTKPWSAEDLLQRVLKAAQHFHMVKELAHERQMLCDLMDSVPDGIFFKDADLRFLRANRAHAELVCAGTSEALVGRHLRDTALRKDEALRIEAEERRVLAGAPAVDLERTEGSNGSQRWLSESKAAIRNAGGEPIGLVGIVRDITERKRQQERIARLTRVRSVTSGINSTIVRTRDRVALLGESCQIAVKVGQLGLAFAVGADPAGGVLQVLAAHPPGSEIPTCGGALQGLLLGSKPAIVEDAASLGFAPGERRAALAVFPLHVTDGHMALCLLSRAGECFDKEEIELLSEVTENISFGLEHIAKTERLDFLTGHDQLTALPKRTLFLDRLNRRIEAGQSSGEKVAALVIDIGRFRQINETLGRAAGDQLLVQIASRLTKAVCEEDVVARLDSNTFAVLSSCVSPDSELAHLVENAILASLKEPFTLSGTEVRVAARVGIAVYPADGNAADAVVAHAEAALRNAKGGLARYAFYASSMQERVSERLTLETRLRQAVEAEAFELHYQPKVELRTGLVVGLEALLRWTDPVLGPVSPAKFIPVLEETGLIHEVGRWALERAGWQSNSWRSRGLPPPRIAVNVSAIQLAAADLERTLQRCAASSDNIDIEITESVFVKDLAGSIAKLAAARQLGMRVAIDDFGTGYSSLGYLSRLPIDALKIDRSFIINMATDPQQTTIVTTIISLAHAMDLKVIAEGVETKEQARLLRLLKCDQIQGYLVSRPQPATEIEKVLGTRLPVD